MVYVFIRFLDFEGEDWGAVAVLVAVVRVVFSMLKFEPEEVLREWLRDVVEVPRWCRRNAWSQKLEYSAVMSRWKPCNGVDVNWLYPGVVSLIEIVQSGSAV